MVSEKLISILLSRTDMTREEILRTNESDGWRLVYELDRQKRLERTPEVCFTGFGKADRERLAGLAETGGFNVKDVVTQGLVLLIAGENAGPSKIKKAELQNCPITNEAGFLEFLEEKKRIDEVDRKIAANEQDVAQLREKLLEGLASPVSDEPMNPAYFERLRQLILSTK